MKKAIRYYVINYVICFLLLTPLYSQNSKPNIIFIFADDLGFADLGVYGHPYAETPRLDKMASEGTVFKNFHVAGVTCQPSRAGLMTGKHVVNFPNVPRYFSIKGTTTITALLAKNGYHVGHFGKWHISNEREVEVSNGMYGIHEIGVIKGDKEDPGGQDAPLFSAAVDFIERNKDIPFYMNVWGHITHYPVIPHFTFQTKFTDLVVDRNDFDENMQQTFDEALSIGGVLNDGMAEYLREVFSLDAQVGRILDKLDEMGITENTIVVFSSDHGPAPVLNPNRIVDPAEPYHPARNMLGYAGGFRGGKFDQYEGGVRSPFIVKWPDKVPAGKVNETSLMSALDWFPSVAKVAGITFEDSLMEGEDVSDIWMGADRSRKESLFWKTHNGKFASILDGNWKLHEKKNGEPELYDLTVDPGERNNIAGANPKIVDDLMQQIIDWKAGHPTEYAADGDTEIPVGVIQRVRRTGKTLELTGSDGQILINLSIGSPSHIDVKSYKINGGINYVR